MVYGTHTHTHRSMHGRRSLVAASSRRRHSVGLHMPACLRRSGGQCNNSQVARTTHDDTTVSAAVADSESLTCSTPASAKVTPIAVPFREGGTKKIFHRRTTTAHDDCKKTRKLFFECFPCVCPESALGK